MAIFGAGPSIIFVVWMLSPARTHLPHHLTPVMWSAGTWIMLAPALIVLWEAGFESLMCVVDNSNNIANDIRERMARAVLAIDKKYPFIASLLMAAIILGYCFNNRFFRDQIGSGNIGSSDFFAGLFVVTTLGYAFGVGIWAVAKSLIVARIGIQDTIQWHPFGPDASHLLNAYSTYSYRTGTMFSSGGLFLPGVYIISGQINIIGRILAALVAAPLVFGSLLCFLYPTHRIYFVAKRQKDDALGRFGEVLEAAQREALQGSGDMNSLASRVQTLLSLRAAIASEPNFPASILLIVRAGSLFLIPIFIGFLQAALGAAFLG